jgi:hypothetical protein
MHVTFAALTKAFGFDPGVKGAVLVRDLWLHKDLGVFTDEFSAEVVSHGVVHVNLTPQ